ncbi:MAG: pirin family protein [Sphingobium sp.]|uniref:pirin family protein n=1 Tax=Sphingomonas melonis TaxID=152682 RepID=UPI000375E984|nr:pirin family protein [Sphingomonas melonis]MBS47073.1 pirin family protein [Sphingobium sp.]|tara:strand:+ start:3232 stop:4068 length:837 start_codon:yes stop_codon:yes gene_type:complete
MTERTIVSKGVARREDNHDLITRIPPVTMAGPTPFLLIVHHGPQVYPPDNHGLPFAPHPHRGFETITFVRTGALLHEDSRSSPKIVHAGGVQWMTAGSGIVHNESAPPALRKSGGPFEVLQLWLNLPSTLKGAAPHYVGLEAEDIPSIAIDGATINLVAGRFEDIMAPIRSLTDATMMVVDLAPGGTAVLPAPEGRSLFLYVVEGEVNIGGETVEQYSRVMFDDMGDRITVTSADGGTIIYGHAPPINEPVAARGPFVMTSPAELMQAARDYQAGLFA